MNRLQIRYWVALLLLPLLMSSGPAGVTASPTEETPAVAPAAAPAGAPSTAPTSTSAPAAAADAPADAEAEFVAPVADEPPAAAPRRPDTPLARDVLAVEEAFHAELARLSQAFQGAADDGEALAAQRRIEALKANLEVTLLEIQARHARAAGRADLAGELEELIAQARANAAEPVPVPTPAPAPAAGADPNTAPAR